MALELYEVEDTSEGLCGAIVEDGKVIGLTYSYPWKEQLVCSTVQIEIFEKHKYRLAAEIARVEAMVAKKALGRQPVGLGTVFGLTAATAFGLAMARRLLGHQQKTARKLEQGQAK